MNHPLGKNMIGAFHQPVAVEIDTDVPRTLPAAKSRPGWPRSSSTASFSTRNSGYWCEANAARLRALDADALA